MQPRATTRDAVCIIRNLQEDEHDVTKLMNFIGELFYAVALVAFGLPTIAK